MTYEEFLQLSKAEQLNILLDYAAYNFHEGEQAACDFEYGRDTDSTYVEFDGWLKSIKK